MKPKVWFTYQYTNTCIFWLMLLATVFCTVAKIETKSAAHLISVYFYLDLQKTMTSKKQIAL